MTDKATVLVVDDDLQIAEALRLRLETAGYAVVVRHDGAAGLAAMQSQRIDALITDIAMPVMDGEAMLSRLSETGWAAATPIIVLSTNLSYDRQRRFVELGAHHCIAKPYDGADLLARLKSSIGDADDGHPQRRASL